LPTPVPAISLCQSLTLFQQVLNLLQAIESRISHWLDVKRRRSCKVLVTKNVLAGYRISGQLHE
jgi:hypothetical protein